MDLLYSLAGICILILVTETMAKDIKRTLIISPFYLPRGMFGDLVKKKKKPKLIFANMAINLCLGSKPMMKLNCYLLDKLILNIVFLPQGRHV